MLPTEVQRILLLIGLAATGYLLILAWNDDFMQGPAPETYSAAPDPEPIDLEVDPTREALSRFLPRRGAPMCRMPP